MDYHIMEESKEKRLQDIEHREESSDLEICGRDDFECSDSYDSYSISEEQPQDSAKNDSSGELPPKISPWILFLQLFWSPLKAWKRLKNSGLTPEEVSSKMFYPIVALSSVAQFINKIYNPSLTLGNLLECAIGIFISFFLGYFLVLVLCRLVLPGDGKEKIDTLYGRTWLQYVISTLCSFFIIYEIIPVLEPIMVFAPLYTLYITLRGVRFLRMKSGNETPVGWTVGLLSVAVPCGIYYLFETLVPKL